ncbi:phosphoribosyl-ATP pyrophosphatase [Acetobacter vaccinii]|nr:phosphoribosyl-ATP pyrophosphatase [Acetobacter vaccinii]
MTVHPPHGSAPPPAGDTGGPTGPGPQHHQHHQHPDATTPAPPPEGRDITRLSRRAGQHAMNCTAAYIAGQNAAIAEESALFLLALEDIWAQQGLPPAEVWTELTRRLEVSNLLHRLNHPPYSSKRNNRATRPWRISTSKIP